MNITLDSKEIADVLSLRIEHRYGIKVTEKTLFAELRNGQNVTRDINKITMSFRCEPADKAEVLKAAEDRKIDLNL